MAYIFPPGVFVSSKYNLLYWKRHRAYNKGTVHAIKTLNFFLNVVMVFMVVPNDM